MRFAHAASTLVDAGAAAEQVAAEVIDTLEAPVDLAVLMCTHAYRDHSEQLMAGVGKALSPGHLLGCTGEGIFGGGKEYERGPAVTLLAAHLPGVDVHPFCLACGDMKEGVAADNLKKSGIPLDSGPQSLILLADPYSAPVDILLEAVNSVCPDWSVVGGMASGAAKEGENRLFCGDSIAKKGAVGVALSGRIRTRTLVSQGCKPVGKHFVITRADRNIIYSLGGVSALDRVREVYAEESESVRMLMSSGLMVGHVINEHQESFQRGDFLVRNVMIFDEASGAVVTGEFFRPGQTIQFHVRDEDTAIEDLEVLLGRLQEDGRKPAGGLCFSCNGRGSRMFSKPHHESSTIFEKLGPFPMVGHFAAGEFGDIGGKAFLHGHTLSLAVFSEPD